MTSHKVEDSPCLKELCIKFTSKFRKGMIFLQEQLNSELYYPRRKKTQKLNTKNNSQGPNPNEIISIY